MPIDQVKQEIQIGDERRHRETGVLFTVRGVGPNGVYLVSKLADGSQRPGLTLREIHLQLEPFEVEERYEAVSTE